MSKHAALALAALLLAACSPRPVVVLGVPEDSRLRVFYNLLGSVDVAPEHVYAFTTRGARPFHEPAYAPGDALLFGPETRGLPQALLESLPADCRVRLPMRPGVRSLNLSNAVAVAVYEAWRQHGYAGGG